MMIINFVYKFSQLIYPERIKPKLTQNGYSNIQVLHSLHFKIIFFGIKNIPCKQHSKNKIKGDLNYVR